MRSRGLTAVVVGSAVALGLSACAPAQPPADTAQDAEVVEAAVRAAVPEATDVLVKESGGLRSLAVATRLYAPGADESAAAHIVDAALAAVWESAPNGIDHISISLALSDPPARPSLSEVDGVDMAAVAETLGIDDPQIVDGVRLRVAARELAQRYGARPSTGADSDG
ncbi:hypothetical protein [Schumannella sp. 10F1B-5-1]|uniref:hypothetical protein n=1 Tax=Schumannella sp. 10F1B-5-1 TaxID=2590780 RepID=UPI001130B5E8|nr:hypothetical protein [Schumannella sp. 10F1B-5-1]TPW72266.1 hypothetical protein FJ658_08310 [Schumannella sp. 10F1B-5-1]